MKLILNSEKCVGCRICELACSFHHNGSFSPESSDIRIAFDRSYRVVVKTNVLSTCDFCGECITACPVGAIALTSE